MAVSTIGTTLADLDRKYHQVRAVRTTPLQHDDAQEFLEMVYDAWPRIRAVLKEAGADVLATQEKTA
jgi:hypothetical protein